MSYDQYKLVIAKNIKELLEIYSMSILELSNKSGVSYSPLHSITLGKSNPNLETLYKICVVFNIDIAQLIGDVPLKLINNNTFTTSIPLLDWTIESINQKHSTIWERITVTCPIKLSSESFTLKVSKGNLFLQDTFLIFDTPSNAFHNLNQKIILVSSENNHPNLKKLIIDGKALYLESIFEKIPIRKLISSDKIIASLVQGVTNFL